MKQVAAIAWAWIAITGCYAPQSDEERYQQAKLAWQQGDIEAAVQWAADCPITSPHYVESRHWLGEAAFKRGDFDQALRFWQQVPRDGSEDAVQIGLKLAGWYQSQGRLQAAIEEYEALRNTPQTEELACGALVSLYALSGQRRQADALLWHLLHRQDLSFRQLVLLSDFDRQDPNAEQQLLRSEQLAWDDPAVQLGLAVLAWQKLRQEEVRERLQRALRHPHPPTLVHALWGELLLEDDAAWWRWHAGLPPAVLQSPEIWWVRALKADRMQQTALAVSCLLQTWKATPTSFRIEHLLGDWMPRVEPVWGEKVRERAQQTYHFRQAMSRWLNSHARDEAALREVITRLHNLGRWWEASAWGQVAWKMFQSPKWLEPLVQQWQLEGLERLPRIVPDYDVIAQFLQAHPEDHVPEVVLARFAELGESLQVAESLSQVPPEAAAHQALPAVGTLRFEESAEAWQLRFTYDAGQDPQAQGVRMQESTGGGIGVLDYDRDGLPDVFFTQGEPWPLGADRPNPVAELTDRLFRHTGQAFVDVTTHAFPQSGDDDYGQGVAAGDVNHDGFPDLYVANIGINRLWLNQGDGTFREITPPACHAQPAWTTSCLMADLNADGHPDLYDVNYLEGEELYRKLCDENMCTPQAHRSACDQVWLSRGDGTWVGQLLDLGVSYGAGLGVVAFRWEGQLLSANAAPQRAVQQQVEPTYHGLNVFVANDHEPNFLLVTTEATDRGAWNFREEAFLRGVAVGRDGRPQACMGVAAGDFNGDGRLDLFVTNYKDEANNLFLQEAPGWFSDAIGRSGLEAAGVPYVGWGTQAADFDLDGWLDLIVANGHVGDFRKPGLECYMPTQLFRQEATLRFRELRADEAGHFFQRKLLGRTVALLDADRDGRVDVLIAPIGAPVSLLLNRSPQAGHWLVLRVVGTRAPRDPHGTLVTLVTSHGILRRQWVAGDGYQVTNEPIIHFGLGDVTQITRLEVDWPGGDRQVWEHVATDKSYLVIEGEDELTPLQP
ncbi:MAG: RNA-binding protein [Planctomycetaceae bacterium]|nr:MAG: RNA-binding protein [Planctomycetaceae bacterium]